MNVDSWFVAPLSGHQILSWILLTLSAVLAAHTLWLLHTIGKPDSRRTDASLIGIERTTELVTIGAYRYIRHPAYGSLLYLTWGVFFKGPSMMGAVLAE